MRRLSWAAALLVLASAACDTGSGAGPIPEGGRLLAQRIAQRTTTLLSGSARATYCPTDSTLVIIALGSQWTSGIALHAPFPVAAATDFQVQPSLGGAGTATAAFRPVGAGVARLGSGGVLHLEPTRGVSGRFEVTVQDSGGSRVVISGRMSGIPVTMLTKGACQRS